ncbi:MAG: hypothetical protein ACYCU5_10210 [Actinomycetes bacterium]
MGRPRYKRAPAEPAHRDQRDAAGMPVVLPHVVMDITIEGQMNVTVDGAPHEPDPFAPPWRREDFAAILDQLTDQRRSPVRVEVREADGTVFTDIITPGKRRRPDPEPETPDPPVTGLLALHGEGFVPGEDVAVAVVLVHSEAAPDGTARALLAPDLLVGSPTREVILLGRVSGAVTVGHPA